MTTLQAPAKNLVRVHRRGQIISILEKETILTGIKVFDDWRFTIEAEDWSSYWQPLYKLGYKKVEENLNALYFAWRDYLRSRFNSTMRQEFCFRYFSLLNLLLSVHSESDATQSWINAYSFRVRMLWGNFIDFWLRSTWCWHLYNAKSVLPSGEAKDARCAGRPSIPSNHHDCGHQETGAILSLQTIYFISGFTGFANALSSGFWR